MTTTHTNATDALDDPAFVERIARDDEESLPSTLCRVEYREGDDGQLEALIVLRRGSAVQAEPSDGEIEDCRVVAVTREACFVQPVRANSRVGRDVVVGIPWGSALVLNPRIEPVTLGEA